MVALMATVTSFSLASCGGDDDDGVSGDNGGGGTTSSQVNGQVTVRFNDKVTYTYYGYQSAYHTGHQEVTGSVLDNLKTGATFIAYFSDKQLSSDDAELIYINHNGYMQIDTADEIKEGAEINIRSCHWMNKPLDSANAGYFDYDCEGKVTVKSIKNGVVQLQFNDFKFNYIAKFSVGSSTFSNVVMNGLLSFTYEEQ